MKAPTKEVVYINENLFRDESTYTPSHSQVVYGDNPNLTTNEYGQTIVNPNVPIPLTPKEQAQQLVDDIKETIANTPKPKPKKTITNVLAVNKELEIAKTTTPKKTTNYLLYGALGIGAVVILMGIFKKD
jgi:hypothetical protein